MEILSSISHTNSYITLGLPVILLSEHKSGQTHQAASSLLLAREHSPDVNNKPNNIPYLEQG